MLIDHMEIFKIDLFYWNGGIIYTRGGRIKLKEWGKGLGWVLEYVGP